MDSMAFLQQGISSDMRARIVARESWLHHNQLNCVINLVISLTILREVPHDINLYNYVYQVFG